MLRWILALFIIAPAVEIYLLIQTGRVIGGLETLLLIIGTGFLGAFLAKREGRRVWEFAQHQMSRGELPADSLLDGICIFAGGMLLLAPGFLSDVAGLFLILPFTRPLARLLILRFIRKRMDKGGSIIYWRR
jgi:UPF0716 protein FxsA